MKQYKVTLKGQTPLLMHNDNLTFGEEVETWRKAPENKTKSKAGDDRNPAWTWIGYLYHDRKHVGVSADNIMTMLREGGSKVILKGKETFKKQTQSGIMLDQHYFKLYINDELVPYAPIDQLIKNTDFNKHLDTVENLGFELLVKRAKIGNAKHIRVRPMFRTWELRGSFTIIDEELTGLTHNILETILNQAGSLCGLCDWRPSSPRASGTFGRFTPHIELMK